MKSSIILCGGQSRRLGRDKGSLIIKDKPMIKYILSTLNNEIDEAIIVLNDSEITPERSFPGFTRENSILRGIMGYCAEGTDTKGIELCCSRTQLPQPPPRLRRQLWVLPFRATTSSKLGRGPGCHPCSFTPTLPSGKGPDASPGGRWLFHAFLTPFLATAKILVIKPQHGVRTLLRESKSYSLLCH